eukprot:c9989_g1_i1.p1 GENE.c9989_g1_i1~~c9989_g1_i1.p1  ORF type:complete len:243 (+),score=33.74 c9989_g1_i1:129-857(+)
MYEESQVFDFAKSRGKPKTAPPSSTSAQDVSRRAELAHAWMLKRLERLSAHPQTLDPIAVRDAAQFAAQYMDPKWVVFGREHAKLPALATLELALKELTPTKERQDDQPPEPRLSEDCPTELAGPASGQALLAFKAIADRRSLQLQANPDEHLHLPPFLKPPKTRPTPPPKQSATDNEGFASRSRRSPHEQSTPSTANEPSPQAPKSSKSRKRDSKRLHQATLTEQWQKDTTPNQKRHKPNP